MEAELADSCFLLCVLTLEQDLVFLLMEVRGQGSHPEEGAVGDSAVGVAQCNLSLGVITDQ